MVKNVKTKLQYKTEILITGATGFVGNRLIKKLVKIFEPKKILCLIFNKNTQQEIDGQRLLSRLKVKIQPVDLTDKNTLKNLPSKPKFIIHLAAQTDTSSKDHRVNDIGTINLINALGGINETTHFIHIGTMIEVVGRPDTSKPIDEASRDYPTNEYTRTKLIGEKYVTKRAINDKFRLTIIRPNTIYGKGFRKNSLFDMVIKMIKKDSIVTRINWPGKAALIHVDDVVDLIVKLLKESPAPGKPVKYLAYAENLSIYQISQIVHTALKKKFKPLIIHNNVWSFLKKMRKFIPLLEKLIPYNIYNYLWRLGIIVDNVVYCNSDKLRLKFKTSFKKLSNVIDELI